MLTSTSKSLVVAVVLLAGTVGMNAQQSARAPVDCANLTGLTFEGNTSITSATPVTSGTLVISPTVTVTNLPPFCRVQGLSKPSSESSIFFEVWLPQQAAWNTRFLSAGEGGYAGNPAYTRNGNDGSMDELLRRGYATAGTDTGHKATDVSWAVGHPEKPSTTCTGPNTSQPWRPRA